MGLQTQCPVCGLVFVIPHGASQAASGYPQQQYPQQQFPQQQYPQQQYPQQSYPQQQYPQQPQYPQQFPQQQYPQQPYPQQQYPQQPYPQQQYPQQQYPEQQYPEQPAGGFPAPQSPAYFAPQAAQHEAAPQYPPFEEPDAAALATPESPLAEDLEDVAPVEGDIEPAFLHIPCPNGHELETPFDMLDQEVLCPHCGAQFLLREEDSVEHHERMEMLDSQRAHVWFYWAIAAAVIVVVSLLAMVFVAMRG